MKNHFALALVLVSVGISVSCGNKSASPPACGVERACDCQPGDTNCNECQTGYRAALVGSACVPTCAAPDFDCGAHGECADAAQGAECLCQAGYTGSRCSMCEGGLSPNQAGQCFGKLEAPALLTLSSVAGEVVLGALTPPAWDLVPLASVSSGVTDVAYAAASQDVYLLDEGKLFSLELSTGKAERKTASDVDLGAALCLDEAGQRAYTASAEAVYQIDLETFDVTEVAAFGARALEYDAERGLLIGVNQQGATFELVGSEPMLVGQAPALESLAMAFDSSSGRAYFLGAEPETQQARLLRFCREALARLGAVPAWQEQVVADVAAGDPEPYALDYDGMDAALVAIDLGDTAVSSLRVATTHPDAAVCVVTEGTDTSKLQIELTAETRASFVLVAAPFRAVDLDLTALSGYGGTSVAVYTGERLSIAGPSAGVAEYGDSAWHNLGLTTVAELAPEPSSSLVLMDWASQATLPVTVGHHSTGTALAWVGEVP